MILMKKYCLSLRKKNFLKTPGKLSCQMTVDYNSLKKQKQTQCMMRVLVLSNISV